MIIGGAARNVYWLMRKTGNRRKNGNSMHHQWIMELKDEHHECKYIKGIGDIVADYSSRSNKFEEIAM